MISVVGVGHPPIDGSARARIARAALVVGARRHLESLKVEGGVELGGDLDSMLETVASCDGDVVVLASGDPGFFGIVRILSERFGPDALEVFPSVPFVSAAFARCGLPWDDAIVVSAHGRDPRIAINACRAHPKVAVLTSPTFGPADLARALEGVERTYLVAERLGAADERVVMLDGHEVASRRWRDPNVVVVLDHARSRGRPSSVFPPRSGPTTWALPEEVFEQRDSMITKAEVRALVLARLGPGLGDLIWDVGTGSGSVAVECARFGAAVIAVDRDERACALATSNAQRHGVSISVVHGSAPRALEDLPAPDGAFVGGAGADLFDVLALVSARVRRCAVTTLVTLERMGPAVEAMSEGGLEVAGVQLRSDRLVRLGNGHRLEGTNPVLILWGERT